VTFALFILHVVLSYMHPGEIVPALAPYRIAYWVAMAGLAVAIGPLLRRRGGLLANLQLWVLIVFAAVIGLSLMVAERWLGAPVLAMQRFGPSLTIFVLAICSVKSLLKLRIAAGCVIVLTMTLMLQGAAAYHLGYNTQMFLLDRATRSEDPAAATAVDQADPPDDSVDEVSDDTDDTAEDDEGREDPRIQGLGLMHDPNDLAMGMAVALGLIGGAWKARLQLRHLLLAAASGALVYGIYLTRSRGGALALVVVLWRFAAGRVGRVPALVLLVALGAGALALDFGGRSLSIQPDESASERLVAWTEGLEMLKAQPILGVGYGQFLDHHTLTAHNSLVLCFAETGLLGCFFWVGLFVVTLLELRGLRNLPGNEPFDDMARQWAEGLQLSLIGFMTAAFFLSRTFVPTLYLIIGLSAALVVIARDADRPIRLPALPELGTLVLGCELGGIAVVYTIVKLQFA
jgi:putative inorganic carbon (HCO3(-)) transporter